MYDVIGKDIKLVDIEILHIFGQFPCSKNVTVPITQFIAFLCTGLHGGFTSHRACLMGLIYLHTIILVT